jgi:hypothetical protein
MGILALDLSKYTVITIVIAIAIVIAKRSFIWSELIIFIDDEESQ